MIRKILFDTAIVLGLVGFFSLGCSGTLDPNNPNPNPNDTPDASPAVDAPPVDDDADPLPDTGGPIIDNPQQFFTDNINGLLEANCATCHADRPENTTAFPRFLGATPADNYTVLLTGYPTQLVNTTAATSKIYTYVQNGHYNTYNATQQQYFYDWIEAEAAAR